MSSQGYDYIRHIYKVEKVLSSYTIYGLVEASNTLCIKLSTFVRLERFRGNPKESSLQLLLRGRDATKWASRSITGLYPILQTNLFYGAHKTNGSKNLLVINIYDDTMVIDYFNGFYPRNNQALGHIIDNLI